MNGILKNTKNKIIVMLKWCSLILCLISLAIFLTLNVTPILVLGSHHVVDGVTHWQLMRDYVHLLGYLQIPGGTLRFQFIPMSGAGRQHFADVKNLMLLNEGVLVVSGWLTFRNLSKQKRQHQLWQLMLPLKGLAVFIPTLMMMLLINFNALFIQFHELVFQNQDWVFDPATDPIINVLTEGFFGLCVLIFTALLEGAFGGLYFAGKRQLR